MSVKFSLAQHTVPDWTPAEMIYNAGHIGYDMVSIRMLRQNVVGERVYDMVENPRYFQLAREAVKETGVQIHDIDLAMIREGHEVAEYEPYFELAEQLGVRGVVCSIWSDQVCFYLEEFARLCELAARYHLTVYLEFVTWAGVSTFQKAKYVLEAVQMPNAKILVDAIHYHRSRVHSEELGQCPREWLQLIHLCDAPGPIPDRREELIRTCREERLYAGEGAIKLAEILAHVPEDFICSLEIPHRQRREQLGAYEFARRCLATARNCLQKNGVSIHGND